jgi:hypothetical protein
MWTPQVIFCIAAYCWIAAADPLPTEEACFEHATVVMVPVIATAARGIVIHDVRCEAQDPAA